MEKDCPYCGETIKAIAKKCRHCDEFLDEDLRAENEYDDGAEDPGQDAAMRMLLPVGRSAWAVAAGYLGLLSPLIIFAPFALLTGILALRDIKAHPDRHGMGRAIFGIVMGALMTGIFVVAMIAR